LTLNLRGSRIIAPCEKREFLAPAQLTRQPDAVARDNSAEAWAVASAWRDEDHNTGFRMARPLRRGHSSFGYYYTVKQQLTQSPCGPRTLEM